MDAPRNKHRSNPEAKIQAEIVAYLRAREWFVVRMVGNALQRGVPDLYATHALYKARWIEVKNPKKYQFTAAQMQYFPQYVANGAGIWVMTAATNDEYQKLFKPCNWHLYLKL